MLGESSSVAPDVSSNETVSISLDEIKLMISVIDVVSKRGGFSPRDFSAVGKLYEMMVKHVEK